MHRWTPARAARLGFLAGKGASIDVVRADPMFRSRSEQSLAHASTRWHISFGSGGAPPKADALAVHVSERDLEILEAAAHERGLSVASFTATMIHIAAAERLLGAIMDDERD
jgi:hypothetical protein